MLKSKPTAGKATRRDLWECNVDVLADHYPTISGKDPFDHSSADNALMAHLAFWTGKDAELMDCLFRNSGRMRDKWDEVHDGDGRTYGQVTIEKAVASCKEVYTPQSFGGHSPDQPAQVADAEALVERLAAEEPEKLYSGRPYSLISSRRWHNCGRQIPPTSSWAWRGSPRPG